MTFSLSRGKFRVKGDTLEIATASENVMKIEFFGDEVEKITEIDALTGHAMRKRNEAIIYPATEYTVVGDRVKLLIEKSKTSSPRDCRSSEARENSWKPKDSSSEQNLIWKC